MPPGSPSLPMPPDQREPGHRRDERLRGDDHRAWRRHRRRTINAGGRPHRPATVGPDQLDRVGLVPQHRLCRLVGACGSRPHRSAMTTTPKPGPGRRCRHRRGRRAVTRSTRRHHRRPTNRCATSPPGRARCRSSPTTPRRRPRCSTTAGVLGEIDETLPDRRQIVDRRPGGHRPRRCARAPDGSSGTSTSPTVASATVDAGVGGGSDSSGAPLRRRRRRLERWRHHRRGDAESVASSVAGRLSRQRAAPPRPTPAVTATRRLGRRAIAIRPSEAGEHAAQHRQQDRAAERQRDDLLAVVDATEVLLLRRVGDAPTPQIAIKKQARAR